MRTVRNPSWRSGRSPPVFLLVGLAGSAILGWLSYRLLERPFLRLKRLFDYCGAGTSSEAAVVSATRI